MPLITSIEQVQATGLRITNMDRGARLPDMDFAEQEYLLPHLGKELLTACHSATPSSVISTLLPHVRKALAAFAYWNDLPHLHSRITDAGVRRTTTDNAPAAFRWEYEEARSYLEERAYAMLENLLRFLTDNQIDYPEWTDNEAAIARRNSVLIKNGRELNEYYRLYQPYSTYTQLLPTLLLVERMYLEPLVGKPFLQSFREAALLTPEEDIAADLMKHSIAQLCIYEASKSLPCKVTSAGFMIRMQAGSAPQGAGMDGQQPAGEKVLHSAAQAALALGKKNLAALRKYLNTTASPTIMADYYDSPQYNPGNEPVVDRKNNARKIFRW